MPSAFGHARASTDCRTLDAQAAQLEVADAGAGGGRVFRGKTSGEARNRPKLARLLASLSPGDLALVIQLGRRARDTRDSLDVLAAVARKGAALRSLRDPSADTAAANGRLVLTVLAGLAEVERALIRSRTGGGRVRAKAAGVTMGRLRELTPHFRQEARDGREAGETLVSIARSRYAHHPATIGRP